jgi:hypothetical protein
MREQKHVNCSPLFSDFNQIGMCLQILVKFPYIKFYKNLFSSFRVSTYVKSGMPKRSGTFFNFPLRMQQKMAKVPNKTASILLNCHSYTYCALNETCTVCHSRSAILREEVVLSKPVNKLWPSISTEELWML